MRRRGFSTIELVLAAVILLCGFFAVARVNPTGYRGATVTSDRLLAYRVARNVMDEVRALPYNDQTRYAALKRTITLAEQNEGASTGREFEVTQVNVTCAPILAGQVPPSFGNISVTVEWRDPAGNVDGQGRKRMTFLGGLSREP